MIADVAALDAFPDLIAVLDCHGRAWQLGKDEDWYCVDIRERGTIPEDCFPVVPLVLMEATPIRFVLDYHGRLWQLGADGNWYCIDIRQRGGVIPDEHHPLASLAPLTSQPAITSPDPSEET